MQLHTSPVTGVPQDYVADERDMDVPGAHDVADEAIAAAGIREYLSQRVAAVLAAVAGRPAVFLSGGIDSILVASELSRQQPDAIAVTFAAPGTDEADDELTTARRVAADLGLEHAVVTPSVDEFVNLVVQTVAKLEVPEPWEVLAGVVLLACEAGARELGADGALLTGAGADALFLGGAPVDLDTSDPVPGWDAAMRDKVRRNFVRERLIPDFYERLIDEPDRHIQLWQTHAGYELAQRLAPSIVRGPSLDGDKQIFRSIAEDYGIAVEHASNRKNPMQVSTGGVDYLVQAARSKLAENPVHRIYGNPMTEDIRFTVARLWLTGVLNEARGNDR